MVAVLEPWARVRRVEDVAVGLASLRHPWRGHEGLSGSPSSQCLSWWYPCLLWNWPEIQCVDQVLEEAVQGRGRRQMSWMSRTRTRGKYQPCQDDRVDAE
jgi:hypothetical protein